MMMGPQSRTRRRSGITLTEILIAIMILGVGLVSLATLFPIGLLRLRDAARSTRTKYLVDSAGADGTARTLFASATFGIPDAINFQFGLTPWWWDPNTNTEWNPLVQDTAFYGDVPSSGLGVNVLSAGGYGLPFAYDPLWRYQTLSSTSPLGPNGYYLGDTFEARFGQGIGFIRDDPTGGMPSAHGLQRITNFNRPFVGQTAPFTPIMPISTNVPNIFVSQEDVVWVEALASNQFSSVLPDLSLTSSPLVNSQLFPTARAPAIDWHYSWMFTGYQVSSSGGSTFEGNVVIFENRPFGIDPVPKPPNNSAQGVVPPNGTYQVEGETVVEAIFGHSGNIVQSYGAGADRTVLLRWYSTVTDPVVKVGDWIADVTYERQALVVYNPNTGTGRFLSGNPPGVSLYPNPFNTSEWDNLPAQRCFWYQVQKVTPAIDDPYTNNNPPLRSMVVIVDRTLQARTVLNTAGNPIYFNAALISPYVVNVIPQQFTVK